MTDYKISTKIETQRLFKSNFMESMSKIHWTVPLYIYIPVILYSIYLTFSLSKPNVSKVIAFFILGILFWTLLEYTIHRFVFHYEAKSELGKRLIFIFHGIHHTYPNDPLRLVMTPSVSVPLAIIFFLIFHYTLGPGNSTSAYAGLITGYLFYDISHYAFHHAAMKNKVMKALKKNHMLHHYKDHNNGFGVSSPIWDYLFGTK